MNPKQTRFVAEYLKDLNATQAAIRAGYSPTWAQHNATRLTANNGIKAAIAAGTAKQLQAADATAARTLEEMRRLAYSDIRTVFNGQTLKSIHDLTDAQASAVSSIEVIKRNLTSGDGQMDTVYKLKLWDKPRALEMLGKHFALLNEKVELTVTAKDMTDEQLLDAAAQIVAEQLAARSKK